MPEEIKTAPVAAVETPVTPETQPATEAKPVEDKLSPKFAALARREKQLRERDRQIQEREQRLAEKESKLLDPAQLKQRLQESPLETLEEFGMTYDQLVQGALNQPSPQDREIMALKKEIAAIKQDQENGKVQATQAQEAAVQQAMKQLGTEAALLVDGGTDYETIKEMGAIEAIPLLIKEVFDSQGILMTVEEAAKEVEAQLLEEALKHAQLKKVQEKLKAMSAPPAPEAPKSTDKPTQSQPSKTLTNAMSQTSKPLTQKERRERAILAFKGLLK